MALAPFFKLFKNKSFNYTPRYYDERKEELEKRIAQIKKEMGVTDDSEKAKVIEKAYSVDIKGKMRSRFRPARRSDSRKSSIRLLIILIVLMAISYFIFYY
jgi:hypothetical protein